MAEIRPATLDDIVVTKIAVLVYGGAGSGKTYFSLLFPDPFVLDLDRGLVTALRMKDLNLKFLPHPSSPNLTYDQVRFILNRITQSPFGKTNVVDTATVLEKMILDELVAEAKGRELPDRREYRFSHKRIFDVIGDLKKLRQHLVVTAGEMFVRDSKTGNVLRIQPDFIGVTVSEMVRLFDEVYYLEDNGNNSYTVHTQSNGIVYAKSRLGIPNGQTHTVVVKHLLNFVNKQEESTKDEVPIQTTVVKAHSLPPGTFKS